MPTAHTGGAPSSTDINNGAAIITGARFTVSTALTCNSIDFYRPATAAGTYTAELYQTTADDDPLGSGTGTLLGTGTLASGSSSAGWNAITLSSPVLLSAGVVYTACVHSSSGRYVATSGGLATAISAGGVTLLGDGSDPHPPALGSMRNGVFEESATPTYPRSSFGSTDYWIDVAVSSPTTVAGVATAALGGLAASAAGARMVSGTLAATLGGLTARAVSGLIPVTRGGNWYDLISILDTARAIRAEDDARAPVVCPNDLQPLMTAADGRLYCPFDGWRP